MSPSPSSPSLSGSPGASRPGVSALDDLQRLGDLIRAAHAEISSCILGQDSVIDHCLTGLMAGGHVLLVGMPGLAKTRLVHSLGQVLGLADQRVQFTPDLMPGDILGSEVLEEAADGRRSFRFLPGPVFCQLLMADEINRASPRTQSALLQAMQEGQVSIAGKDYLLPQPFHVLATQNPIEQEGTYPLPEAQLDRFMLHVQVDYPDRQAERAMLLATTGAPPPPLATIMTAQQVMDLQTLVRQMPVGESVLEAILTLVRSGRPEHSSLPLVQHHVIWGPGPRAGQALMLAVRARALLQGRLAPSLDDVSALAAPVLRHRMALSYAARADGLTVEGLIDHLLAAAALPPARPAALAAHRPGPGDGF